MMQMAGGGGGTTGAGSGSSYQSEARASQDSAIGGATFGDVNVGQGAGSGLKLSPMLMAAALAVVGLFAFFMFRK